LCAWPCQLSICRLCCTGTTWTRQGVPYQYCGKPHTRTRDVVVAGSVTGGSGAP
jgi:hypothetical protein